MRLSSEECCKNGHFCSVSEILQYQTNGTVLKEKNLSFQEIQKLMQNSFGESRYEQKRVEL